MIRRTMTTTSTIINVNVCPLRDPLELDCERAAVDGVAVMPIVLLGAGVARITKVDGTVMVCAFPDPLALLEVVGFWVCDGVGVVESVVCDASVVLALAAALRPS